MQNVRDAAILLLLVLLVASVRVTPLEEVGTLIPEAQASVSTPPAAAASVLPHEDPNDCLENSGMVMMPAIGPQSPPPADRQPAPEISIERDHRSMVLIRVMRDRPDRTNAGECPDDSGRSHEAPANRSAC